MPQLLYTVENLVDEVRYQLDEQSQDAVSTEKDILPALNRAQIYAFDILSRKYPEPILRYSTLTTVGGVSEYDIPEDVFEDRILKLEVQITNSNGRPTYQQMDRISYRDLTNYESSSLTAIPRYYAIYGRKMRLVGIPQGLYPIRMWSLRNPEKLVMPQGRITTVNSGSNYVNLDGTGSDLSTEADQLQSYVNFVDGQTGEIRGTSQIQILNNDRLTVRTSPLRAMVLGRTVTGAIPTDASLDDYVCNVDGICVPYYGQPICNFLIQFAVNELTRKLQGAADMEEKILERFEQQVERTWAGRELELRVKKKNRIWGVPTRRWYWQ